jgi:microcystin degradation protein MlrC
MVVFAWRRRDALLGSTRIHPIRDGVALARQAVAEGRRPVVLADHSDRSGHATWLMRELLVQRIPRALVATIAAPQAVAALRARGAAPGDRFDMEVGGLVDPSAGAPVRVAGTLLRFGPPGGERAAGQDWAVIGFGEGCVLVLSPFLAQIMEPDELRGLGIAPEDFDVIALKSRVHFRRGFDDSGFARTILLVEPEEPFLGTVRLEALPYRHLRIGDFHPYGTPPDPLAGT